MSLRTDLAAVVARSARYSMNAYCFVFEALEFTKTRSKLNARKRAAGKRTEAARHVTPQELCWGARDLALRHYGLLALTVLNQWGIHSTSDLGEIVFNLIGSGDLEQRESDSRADFDNVFEFEAAFRNQYVWALDDVA